MTMVMPRRVAGTSWSRPVTMDCAHGYAHSRAAQVWVRRFPFVKHIFVGHDILLDGLPHRSRAMDLTGGRARAHRIHFRHLPVSPLRTYRRYFGCSVHFGQNEDGVSFSDRDLASPIVDKIKDEVQRDIMLYCCQQTDLEFSVISEKLGCSEQSVMSRSCNLWFSASPTKIRMLPRSPATTV